MNPFRLIQSRLHMRSAGHIVSRTANIMSRYAPSAEPMTSVLLDFTCFSQKHGFRPSFPATASVVARHPGLFRRLAQLGAELAVHGYRHIDHTDLFEEKSLLHFKRADEIFRNAGIPFSGFRFPFLRRNADLIRQLSQTGFGWDSSEVIGWSFERPRSVSGKTWQNYLNILESYAPLTGGEALCLPRREYGLIEIPVSVPDDDILIERLRLRKSEIGHIWLEILDQTHGLGECFVIQLHPERFPFFKPPLETLVRQVQRPGSIWMASLNEIADWWKEKTLFRCHIKRDGKRGWRIQTENADRGLLLGLNIPGTSNFFWRKWRTLSDSCFIQSPRKPVVGLSPDAPESLKIFLADEGFIFEITRTPDEYSVYLADFHPLDEAQKRRIIGRIEASDNPVIRFWRWPRPFVSCFSVTGDIDGVDLWDYWSRFYGS